MKILKYLFILVLLWTCQTSLCQQSEIMEYQFGSTSMYVSPQRGGVYVYQNPPIASQSPYNNKPRRVIGDDDPRPGYDPIDPALPVGDIDFCLIIVMLVSYFILRKKKAAF